MQKNIFILLVTFCLATILFAQEAFYRQRELNAPIAIKQNLQGLRKEVINKNWKFQVGYTDAMNFSINQLAGLKVPTNLEEQIKTQNTIAVQMLEVDNIEKEKFVKLYPGKLPELYLKPSPTAQSMDWRKYGKVTPVKNQMACGSCWAFATLGAYEGNYLIRNNTSINASEQCLVNCSGAGSCSGGWWAFQYLINTGCASEADYAYTANDKPCITGLSLPYKAVAWGYVTNGSSVPTVQQLKQALCQYGPLAVAVHVSGAFQAYTNGVFNENSTGNVNHGVTLIGWDDTKNAWIIKNSWGPNWGETCGYGTERGYMWIAYNSNKIGFAAAWVTAKNIFYKLPVNWKIKPIPIQPIPVQPIQPKYPIKPQTN